MKTCVFLIACALCVGCSEVAPPTSSRVPNSPSIRAIPDFESTLITKPDAGNASAGVVSDVAAGPLAVSDGKHPTDVPSYAERSDVVRLLHRARELYLRSQFRAALEVVDAALAIDPQSPSALNLQSELNEVLIRMDDKRGRSDRNLG